MKLRDLEVDGLAAVELVEDGVRAVVVHGVGPRISWFGRDQNLLYWDHRGEHVRGPWRMRGGHRLWTTRPDADESEESYAADNEPCRLKRVRDGVAVTAPPGAAQIEKRMTVRAQGETWRVEHRLRNVGTMLWAGGAWALTCTLPRARTRYRIPLDGGDARWDSLTIVIPRRWGGGHSSKLADPQFALTEAACEIRARGTEAKRMFSTPTGALEMIDGPTFRIAAPRIGGAPYPLGTNVACYLGPDRFMVELETMSPLRQLAPGESLTHVETWTYR